jgi:hypothetical protein
MQNFIALWFRKYGIASLHPSQEHQSDTGNGCPDETTFVRFADFMFLL